MKSLKLINIPVLFYVVAAVSSPWAISLIGGDITEKAVEIIYVSVLPILIIGLLPQSFKLPRINLKKKLTRARSVYLHLARSFMTLGLAAVWLNFILIGGIPLISGNSIREIFTENLLWNIFIFCSLGVFIEGYRLKFFEHNTINKRLLYFYIFSSVLTGWKAALINILLMYVTSRYPDEKIGILKLIYIAILLITVFLIINFMRAGGGELGIIEIFMYIYWGFVNFSNIAFNEASDCLYTNIFNNCKFDYDNGVLENSTWNVYTALTPIYIDGGGIYVLMYFLCVSVVFLFVGRIGGSIAAAYIRYILMYFIFIAHNGYYFNSKSGLITILIMFLIDIYLRYPIRNISKDF